MDVAGEEQAEQLITRCRLTEAAARLTAMRYDDAGDPEGGRKRLCVGVYALVGDDRNLAGAVAPQLLASRSAADVASYFESLPGEPASHDHLAAAVVLSWATDAAGAYDLWRSGHDRALFEKRFHFAVGARERLAHHAILFGDLEIAQTALDDALRLAQLHRLSEWFSRSAAAAARLALNAGDSERAAQLLARARMHARSPEAIALLAPVGAALAIEAGDDEATAEWTSAEILDTALTSEDLESAVAATVALLSKGAPVPGSSTATALRRAMLRSSGATYAVELLSLAARHGEIEEARLGADTLGALVAPNRKYCKAHALLARAHLLFRSGERAAWIDHAGDAARAFNAMGMRRWMNEAMLLLVRQENEAFPRRRGRPMGSALTGREQQVAHLIRRGARNREVAAALQISEHTVERHVSSILGRLGLRSRWQIADPKNASEH
ncbi:MAG: helix-turn-helix transcriptional regulator [Candidatus Cybelea sp.]|jgi:DNA-binding CsgD family transcriptional regulator